MAADRLLIFARRPAAAVAPTRLSPPLPPDEAAAVYEVSLRDVVARAARERARIELWYEDVGRARAYFETEFPHVPRVAQVPGGLGAKLRDAFAWSFVDEAGRTIIRFSNAPTLPDGFLTAAFADLRDADAVLGPTRDGGCYLIGVRAASWPAAATLLDDVPGSGEPGFRTMIERAQKAGIDLRILPGWYDIDCIDDLRRARADAAPDSHLGRWLAGDAARRYIGA